MPTTTPDLVDLWRDDWYQPAVALPSPHCDARPDGAPIDLIVVHSISLPPGIYGGREVADLFLGTLDCTAHPYFERLRGLRVSAHFFVRRSGSIWQFVGCDQRAWHAGESRYRGRSRCNDDSIGIELEGLEGEPFEPIQYGALARLCRALAARYPITFLAGHEHIAPGRKADPGAGFDWHQLKRELARPALHFPTR
jgi:AmpD protein